MWLWVVALPVAMGTFRLTRGIYSAPPIGVLIAGSIFTPPIQSHRLLSSHSASVHCTGAYFMFFFGSHTVWYIMKGMAPYEVKNEQFKGPLEKLLELIEEKKLEITQLSLADVTADFLNYIKTLEGEVFAQQTVADFLVVASRLILIKSKALLPSLELTEEEETDIKSLEVRLKLYHELKATHQLIRFAWGETPQMFSREFLMTTEPIFYPPANMGPELLRDTLARMVGELEKVFRPTATVRREILHLKQKIEEVLARLTETPTQFNALQKGKGREEIVVLFLAVLHLIKDQFVHAAQDTQFGAITIAKKSPVA